MSFTRNCHLQGGVFQDDYRYPCNIKNYNSYSSDNYRNRNGNWSSDPTRIFNHAHKLSGQFGEHNRGYQHAQPNYAPPLKRRKFCDATWGDSGRNYQPYSVHCPAAPLESSNFIPPIRSNAEASTSVSNKRDRSWLEDDESIFMSRHEIERCSPSRRDGIDALRETHLRYSYCAFIQNLGLQLELPQTTIGTAMVLCHRFFVRRSHACHDRFLIATAALFLAAKSEETPRPLNNVLRTSCEIFHKQDIAFLSYLLPVDWFEQYRERVTEAEQMILTTLNFELSVQHPYDPLTSVLNKLGLSQTDLVNLALNLVSEGDFGWGLSDAVPMNWLKILSWGVKEVMQAQELIVASVQAASYCCRSCLSRGQVSKFRSSFTPRYLARISNDSGNSPRCLAAVDGAVLKGIIDNSVHLYT